MCVFRSKLYQKMCSWSGENAEESEHASRHFNEPRKDPWALYAFPYVGILYVLFIAANRPGSSGQNVLSYHTLKIIYSSGRVNLTI